MFRRSIWRWATTLAITALAPWPAAVAVVARDPPPALRVGVPHLPPWAYHDANCRLTGIAIENLRRLVERAGRGFVAIPLPLDAGLEARKAGGIDLFLGDATLSADLEEALPLPFGHTIDRIAVYQGPWASAATAPTSSLRVGVRTQRLAETMGFADSRVVAGEVNGALADALAAGRLDVLVGGREVIYLAMMRRGWRAATLRSRTRRLGSFELHYHLTRQGDADHGDALRRALEGFDWPRRDQQLRQRFLSPDVARAPMRGSECETLADGPLPQRPD